MLLEIKNLSRSFGGLKALDSLDASIEGGSMTGLIGPNGAGKTTLFNVITGVLEPDSGKVYFKGEEITNIDPTKILSKGIGRTFQTPRIFGDLTVLENLTIVPENIYETPWRGLYTSDSFSDWKDKVGEKACKILQETALYDKRESQANSLNVGEQKILEICRILMGEPKLLLLDEPFAGISEQDTERVLDFLEEIRENRTMTIIEHKMRTIMEISENIVVLHEGKKLAEGSPEKIASNSEVKRVYLGE